MPARLSGGRERPRSRWSKAPDSGSIRGGWVGIWTSAPPGSNECYFQSPLVWHKRVSTGPVHWCDRQRVTVSNVVIRPVDDEATHCPSPGAGGGQKESSKEAPCLGSPVRHHWAPRRGQNSQPSPAATRNTPPPQLSMKARWGTGASLLTWQQWANSVYPLSLGEGIRESQKNSRLTKIQRLIIVCERPRFQSKTTHYDHQEQEWPWTE